MSDPNTEPAARTRAVEMVTSGEAEAAMELWSGKQTTAAGLLIQRAAQTIVALYDKINALESLLEEKPPDADAVLLANGNRMLVARCEEYEVRIAQMQEQQDALAHRLVANSHAYNRRATSRFRKAKWEAGRRNLTWGLTFEEFFSLVGQPCHYCGGSTSTVGSGLDRKNPSEGYQASNVLPCCKECNRVKSNIYSVEEAEVMIHALLEFRKAQVHVEE